MFKAILRLTKQSVIYGVGHVLTKAVIIILLPIHTNFLSPDEFGITTIVMLFLGIMSIIYSFGLNTAFLQFYMLENDKKAGNRYFSTALIATAITAVVLSTVLFVSKNVISKILFDSQNYGYLIKLSIGILFFDALILLSKNILRAEERSIIYAVFSLINVTFNCLFNIIFVAYRLMGVEGIFLAYFLSSGITFILFLPIVIKHFLPFFSLEMFKRMLIFGFPFIPATLAIFLIDTIDRAFIKHYLGLDATGIYGAGYRVALVIKLFINAFQIAWVPFFLSLANDENAKKIFSKILTYFILICSLIFLIFTMYMDQIIRLNIFGYTIIGREFWGSTQIVPAVILAYIFYGIYLNFLVGVYYKEKTKFLIVITGIGAIVNIFGNIFLIPTFKLLGAAYATVLSYCSMAVLLFFINQQFYPIQYEFRKILKICLLSAIIFFTFQYISLPYELITRAILIFIYLVLLYISGFFESKEIQTIRLFFKGIYGKVSTR